jgi:hypothetical protein
MKKLEAALLTLSAGDDQLARSAVQSVMRGLDWYQALAPEMRESLAKLLNNAEHPDIVLGCVALCVKHDPTLQHIK